jgi:hypothetical protein
MAYIQFLSEQLNSKEELFVDIMSSAYNIFDIEFISCYYNKEFNIGKTYISNLERTEERINFLEYCIDTYEENLKYPDEENPCVVLNAVKGKRLISLFSADKVRCKRLVLEFAKEYLKLRPTNYLLIDQEDLYDLKRIESLT